MSISDNAKAEIQHLAQGAKQIVAETESTLAFLEPGTPAGVDVATGELPDPVTEPLDALIKAIMDLKGQEVAFREARQRCEADLIHRMQEQGATLYEGRVGTVKLDIKYTYKYNVPLLQDLSQYVKPEEFNKAITYEPKVDKRALNRLEKFGGKVAEIIRQATTAIGTPVLEIKPRDG